MTFNPLDRSTWLDTMTVEQIAAIYQRKVGGIRKSCQQRTFVPAPNKRHPYRWNKVDVLRDLGVSVISFPRRIAS